MSIVLTKTASEVKEEKPLPSLSLNQSHQCNDKNVIYWARFVTLLVVFMGWKNLDVLQLAVNEIWRYVKTQWWYQTVYNETFFVVLWSFPAMIPYKIMDKFVWFHKYRIRNVGQESLFESYNAPELLIESGMYCLPLMLLDTFHVKRYAGVTDDVIEGKRHNWIQITRGLPEEPPMIGDMIRHLIIALILYDLLFFSQHYIFHKVPYLFRNFHQTHHTHNVINVKVTNRLHIVERLILVLSANFGLKIQGAHPLTRSVFIMVFILMLIDNHSGYELPWGYHKILPDGLIGGPRRHYEHHAKCNRNYQPVFTYIDTFLDWNRRRSSNNKKIK